MQKNCILKNLTERQQRILYLIAHGYSISQMASILYYSYETIKQDVSLTVKKLSAKNRAHAVAIAFYNGMFDDKLLINYFKDKI